MSCVSIGPVNLRDLTWICANLRPADRREILCQVPASASPTDFGQAMFAGLAPDHSWIASLDGHPAAAFGFQPFNVATWVGWAFGTPAMIRTIPAITRHCLGHEDVLLGLGVRRVEVRTIDDHDISHRWLARLGCRFAATLPDFGRDGETFELWAWTLGAGTPSERSNYRNVHSQAPAASRARCDASAING